MSKDYGLNQGVYHGVKNCIHIEGPYSYRIFDVYQNEIEKGDVFDEKRLKTRLLKEIVKRNNARAVRYPNAGVPLLSDDTAFNIFTFYSDSDDSYGGLAGKYSLFPLEFICKRCGKVYNAKKKEELKDMPSKCICGGTLEQNTIVLYCSDCGSISSMDLYCRNDGHGTKYTHIRRRAKDDINTWSAFCSKCQESGTGEDIDFIRRTGCKKCGNFVRVPLTVREGGVYSPVVMTFIDLQHKPTGEFSDYVRMAVDCQLITLEGLESCLPETKRGITDDVLDLADSIMNDTNKLNVADYKQANEYILKAVNKIQLDYKGVELDDLNDVRFVRNNSISFDQYLDKLPKEESELFDEWYQQAKKDYGLLEIRYAEKLKVISAAIGQIVGLNKFYEEGFVPHFEPFRKRWDSKDIYSMIVPIETEGILFRLDPLKVCQWLFKNGLIKNEITSLNDAILHITHLIVDSDEYIAVKTLIHSFSHILIKQSNIFTGLDENSCAELLFPLDSSFMIYSTSSVNIGGFEYAFKYSLPNWFSRIEEAAEDCVFDPTCMKEGGKCFSCMYVAEFVCCNFNKELSRQSLVGKQSVEDGYSYEYGFWK